MAQAILSKLLDAILGSLASAAMQELRQFWGADVGKELQNLKSTMSAIQAVLEDAEERQFDSKAVQDSLQKLKEVSYDADDLVDQIVIESQQLKTAESGTKAGKKRKWWDWFSWGYLSSMSIQQDMECRLRDINLRLEKIAMERRDLHLQTRDGNKKHEIITKRRRLVGSVTDESSQVFGRDDDREQTIKSLLSDDSARRKFSVTAIVGMGGVGKTTLAQLIYNDKGVIENFNIKARVCVSEHFNVERLTKEMIESASKSTCNLSHMDSLQCCLRGKLNGKKFLLVLEMFGMKLTVTVTGSDYKFHGALRQYYSSHSLLKNNAVSV